MDFVDLVVKAWKAGYSLFFPIVGKVSKTDKSKLSVLSDKVDFKGIRHFAHGEPDKDAECIVIFPDNSPDRAVAFGFSKLKSIDTTIGKLSKFLISDDGFQFSFDDKFTIKLSSSNVSISSNSQSIKLSDSNIEIESTNITIKGNSKITLDGEVEIKKKLTCKDEISASKSISSDEDVKAGTISLKTHTHTGNLGSPTSPPI